MTTTIYGASDDLIELEGDVNDEFDAYPGDTLRFLTFNDNTVLSIQYANEGDGIWRIEIVRQGAITLHRLDLP